MNYSLCAHRSGCMEGKTPVRSTPRSIDTVGPQYGGRALPFPDSPRYEPRQIAAMTPLGHRVSKSYDSCHMDL